MTATDFFLFWNAIKYRTWRSSHKWNSVIIQRLESTLDSIYKKWNIYVPAELIILTKMGHRQLSRLLFSEKWKIHFSYHNRNLLLRIYLNNPSLFKRVIDFVTTFTSRSYIFCNVLNSVSVLFLTLHGYANPVNLLMWFSIKLYHILKQATCWILRETSSSSATSWLSRKYRVHV